MNFNIGLERKRDPKQAMWYVPCREKPKTNSVEDSERKVETIAHGKWKGERMAFLKVTGKCCILYLISS